MRPLRILLLFFAAAGVAATAGSAAQPAERSFRLVYAATVREIPPGARKLELWLPVPQTTPEQTIRRLRVTAPGPVTFGREPRFGNLALHASVENPSGTPAVTLEITATRRESTGRTEALTPEERLRCLAAEPLVPVDGPVRRLAEEATRGHSGEAAKARALYEHVTRLLKYDKSGTGWGRGDAAWACDAKRGNCTDFHALLIGAARSQGIPARFAMGLPLPEKRGAGEIPGYHCWAELYVRGRWVPVDSSEGAKALARGDTAKKDYFYGHHDENRLELSRGRHLTLEPPQQGEPLNFFAYPHAEVDGKPHAGVTHRFTFTDLAVLPAGG